MLTSLVLMMPVLRIHIDIYNHHRKRCDIIIDKNRPMLQLVSLTGTKNTSKSIFVRHDSREIRIESWRLSLVAKALG